MARHLSLFVAGRRPFPLIALSFRMICYFGLVPIIIFGFPYAGMELQKLPTLDMD